MKIFNYPSEEAENRVSEVTDRGLDFSEELTNSVKEILKQVKNDRDKALIGYINKFDAPELKIDDICVTEEEFTAARKQVSSEFNLAIDKAVLQIESFHKKQRTNSWFDSDRDGVFLGQMVNPVDSAGIYVPGATGGKTPLVSSVLMGGIPARIAGVKDISIVTPPMKDGSVNPNILVAAEKVGIKTVYKAGSAWAIAALTYGTESIKKVDVIAGPGNIYVTLAKKLVSGTVGIDMIAGPSEILVIADEDSNPDYIAADLLSQAEHDTLASSVLVSLSSDIARKTVVALKEQLKSLSRREIAEESLERFGAVFTVQDMDSAIALANRLAPEHLELYVKNPFDHVGRIKNAGAVFMGEYTPEPVGDYIAGPNHVLPTVGTARFASALSVDVFTKKTSVIHYSKDAFMKDADDIILLAETEGLDAHAKSVIQRKKV